MTKYGKYGTKICAAFAAFAANCAYSADCSLKPARDELPLQQHQLHHLVFCHCRHKIIISGNQLKTMGCRPTTQNILCRPTTTTSPTVSAQLIVVRHFHCENEECEEICE